MKILKPTITLILLIALLVLAIREKHTTEKIINNLLYQEEKIQLKTKSPPIRETTFFEHYKLIMLFPAHFHTNMKNL